jgi:hypothetical protein
MPLLEGCALLWGEFAEEIEGEVIALVLGEGVDEGAGVLGLGVLGGWVLGLCAVSCGLGGWCRGRGAGERRSRLAATIARCRAMVGLICDADCCRSGGPLLVLGAGRACCRPLAFSVAFSVAADALCAGHCAASDGRAAHG